MNISRETTHREICKVEGVTEKTLRMCAINLSGSHTNTLEICNGLMKLPTLDQLLESMQKEMF